MSLYYKHPPFIYCLRLYNAILKLYTERERERGEGDWYILCTKMYSKNAFKKMEFALKKDYNLIQYNMKRAFEISNGVLIEKPEYAGYSMISGASIVDDSILIILQSAFPLFYSDDLDYFQLFRLRTVSIQFYRVVHIILKFTPQLPPFIEKKMTLEKLTHYTKLRKFTPHMQFTELPISLESLDLSQVDHPVDILPGLINLTELDIQNNMNVYDDNLLEMEQLTSLHLGYGARITNNGVRGMVLLEKLTLGPNRYITEDGIINKSRITMLNLNGNGIIQSLEGFNNIKLLNIESSRVQEINHTEHLESLYIGHTFFEEDNLKHCTTLKTLSLSFTQQRYTVIKNMTGLTSLSLIGTQNMSDETIHSLKSLTYLDLTRNGDIKSETLSLFPALKILNLTDNEMAFNQEDYVDSPVKFLPSTGLLHLTKLYLRNNNTIKEEHITRLSQLTFLDISEQNTITDYALQFLPLLEILIADENDKITDRGLQYQTNLLELSIIRNERVTNAGILALKYLVKINALHCPRLSKSAFRHIPIVYNDFE